jgi:hypothetical protein
LTHIGHIGNVPTTEITIELSFSIEHSTHIGRIGIPATQIFIKSSFPAISGKKSDGFPGGNPFEKRSSFFEMLLWDSIFMC